MSFLFRRMHLFVYRFASKFNHTRICSKHESFRSINIHFRFNRKSHRKSKFHLAPFNKWNVVSRKTLANSLSTQTVSLQLLYVLQLTSHQYIVFSNVIEGSSGWPKQISSGTTENCLFCRLLIVMSISISRIG